MNKMYSMTQKTARHALAILAACWLLAAATLVEAQGQRQQTGQVMLLDEMEGFLLIDEQRVLFDRDRITVYFRNREVDRYSLLPGMTIRYNLHGDGFVNEVYLLGPQDFLEEMLSDQ